MRNPARYAITYGLEGCYMPDSHAGVYEVHTRRELAHLIRELLSMYDMPASLFRDVRINRLWSFIKRHGSSTAHFHLSHGANALSFHGLTAEEYASESEEDAA